MRATVYVVDEDFEVLQALSDLLRSVGHAVETFGDPCALLSALPSIGAGCILLELLMRRMSGLELQRALPARGCTLPVVFVSAQADVASAVTAMKQGAVDFLQKPVREDDLLEALRRALTLDAQRRTDREAHEALERRLAALRGREREVLERVAKGMLNKQIAAELGIAEVTVKMHRARGMSRLGVGTAVDLRSLLERSAGRS